MPEENNTGTGIQEGGADLGNTGIDESVVPADNGTIQSDLPTDTGIEDSAVPADGDGQEPAEDYESQAVAFRTAYEKERAKRQAIEQQNATFGTLLSQLRQPETPQYDPDDYPNFTQVEQVVGEKINQSTGQLKNTLFDLSVKMAMQNHSDYDKVVPLAIEIANQDPLTRDYILNHKDPGEIAYRLGKTHDAYEKIRRADATKKVTTQINSNSKKAQTLSNTGASATSTMSSLDKINNMSNSEFEAEMERVKEGN